MTPYETAEGFTVEVDPDSRTGWVSGRTGMTLAAIVTPNGASFLSDSGSDYRRHQFPTLVVDVLAHLSGELVQKLGNLLEDALATADAQDVP